jgi:hypothetical protein
MPPARLLVLHNDEKRKPDTQRASGIRTIRGQHLEINIAANLDNAPKATAFVGHPALSKAIVLNARSL